MRKPNTRRAHPTNISAHETDPLPWGYFIVLAICGCVLAAGFFLAARQHFNSMDLGMQNSKLRKQLEDLESENRRLTLAREIAISPAEITRTARHLGFLEVGALAADLPIPLSNTGAAPAPVRATIIRSTTEGSTPSSLTKTAYQRPVKEPIAETPFKQSAKKEAAKTKATRLELNTVAKR